MKDDEKAEQKVNENGRYKWLFLPKDIAAYYYGRLLQIQDEKKEQPERPSYLKEGELDSLTLEQLRIISELEETIERYPAQALSIAKYFNQASNVLVKQLGKRLQEKAKQRANDLLDEA